jgi:hypothetical protein
VSAPSALVLGFGIGLALAATPLLGIGAIWVADRLAAWDGRRG